MTDTNTVFGAEGQGVRGLPAPYVFARGNAAVDLLQGVVKNWKKKYPADYRQYVNEVKYKRENLRNGTGMAASGEYAAVGLLPVRVAAWVENLVPGFWDAGGRELWIDLFPDFRIRTEKLGGNLVSG